MGKIMGSKLQSAIERAWHFNGVKNKDWTPYIHAFDANGLYLDMCLVPIGEFMMGGESGYDNSYPIHKQVIDTPFWVAVHPITNAQWRHAVQHNAVTIPNEASEYKDTSKNQHPVVGVTWHQCQNFANWLGAEWALPTEAEWEYSARGVESLAYPFGNDFQANLVIYKGNSYKQSGEVGKRPKGASWVGAQDMAGNVWDWTNSQIKDYPYDTKDGREDMDSTDNRVLRGGSWLNIASETRATCRNDYDPKGYHELIGFRLVRSIG